MTGEDWLWFVMMMAQSVALVYSALVLAACRRILRRQRELIDALIGLVDRQDSRVGPFDSAPFDCAQGRQDRPFDQLGAGRAGHDA